MKDVRPWLNCFNKSKSITYRSDINNTERVALSYLTGYVSGYKGKDFVKLSSFKEIELEFIVADDSNYFTYDGIIGLGYISFNNDLSDSNKGFISQLKLNGLVKRNLFVQYINRQGNAILTIGEYPEIVERFEYIKKGCDLVESIHWKCKAESVKIKDKILNINSYENEWIFDTGANTNVLTLSNYKKLKLTLLDTYINDNKCFETIIKETLLVVYCHISIINEFSSFPIYINFKESFILVSSHTYFVKDNEFKNYLRFDFLAKTDGSFFDNLLGMRVLSKYISIYDKDNKRFEFIPNPEQISSSEIESYYIN